MSNDDATIDGGFAQGWRAGLSYREVEDRAYGLGLSRRKFARIAVPALRAHYATRFTEDLDASDITREMARRGTPKEVIVQTLRALGVSQVSANDYVAAAYRALRESEAWVADGSNSEPDLKLIAGAAITAVGLLILVVTFSSASAKGGIVVVPIGLLIFGVRLMLR